LPYDLPDCVNRFLAHFRPGLAVILETEVWPNLFLACQHKGIPLVMANACLSDSSFRAYGRMQSFFAAIFSRLAWIGAQTEEDAQRFLALGAGSGEVDVTGNLKFDQTFPEELRVRAQQERARCFGQRRVWIAASTHPGEDEAIVPMFQRLRQEFPDLLLVLAPRHPERWDAVQQYCLDQGLRVCRRSESVPVADAEVFLLDSLGELRWFYGTADLAFVGGSLVDIGGHNLLEPARIGMPVLFGPHVRDIQTTAQGLRWAGGAVQVADVEELETQVTALLRDTEAAAHMAAMARKFADSGRGALKKTVDQLVCILETENAHLC
jgi:3-deoxy-D-manno-octulosonic-acid transferase